MPWLNCSFSILRAFIHSELMANTIGARIPTVAPPNHPAKGKMAQQRPQTADILRPTPRWTSASLGQATEPPFAAIASLRLHIVGAGGTSVYFMGTGWFVTPLNVVTAAHVTNVSEAWRKVSAPVSWHLEVIPGFAGDQRPFGTFWASDVLRHPSWTGRPTASHDIAIVKVAPPNGVAFPPQFCLHPIADAISVSPQQPVMVAGYPHVVDSGATPTFGSGPVRTIEGHLCFYDIDTEDGQSGAPVLTSGGTTGALVAAIHSGGQGSGSTSLSNALNAGLCLRQELVTWINTQ
jgi:V8-like Glu-specific endopeptidase